jgi:hypothetical protein
MDAATAGHGPLFWEVSVNVTIPALTSLAEIKYCGLRTLAEGLNDPPPLVVQAPADPVPPKIPPFNAILPDVAQIDWFGPARTVGVLIIVILTVSETTGQTPLLVELKVKTTEPAITSAGVMLYEVLNELLPGLNDPAPAVPQAPAPNGFTVPLSAIAGTLEHKAWFGPAFTVARGVTCKLIDAATAGQGPLFCEVRVNVTIPALTSPVEIKYCGFKTFAEGLNAPPPLVVQIPFEPVPPKIPPFNAMLPVVAQIDWFGPARTVGVLIIAIFTVSETTGQGPLLVELKVNTTEPATISAGVML